MAEVHSYEASGIGRKRPQDQADTGLSEMAQKHEKTGYVVCLSNRGHEASLMTFRIYCSIPDSDATKHSLIRVIDESGEDYLYPEKMFAAIEIPQEVAKALRKAS